MLDAALNELQHIRRSHANPRAVESRQERDERIVREAEGWSAHDVAIAFRTGKRDVWRAREAAGRDKEFGELPSDKAPLSAEARRAEILRLADKGLSHRDIATRLNIGRSSVRYDLARARRTPLR